MFEAGIALQILRQVMHIMETGMSLTYWLLVMPYGVTELGHIGSGNGLMVLLPETVFFFVSFSFLIFLVHCNLDCHHINWWKNF